MGKMCIPHLRIRGAALLHKGYSGRDIGEKIVENPHMSSSGDIPIRRAKPADAPKITPLINSAGEGIPLHLWRSMAPAGEDPWDFAARRWAEKLEDIDVSVVDFGAGPVACLVGYPTPKTPRPISDDTPAMFRPALELENLAPGSWYINMLATEAAFRGRGLASALLAQAEMQARNDDFDRLSLIVANKKTGAIRLYRTFGFAETARRPIVEDEGWTSDSDEWVLMLRTL
jgi:GNAT superfamily N-acetyltransferase